MVGNTFTGPYVRRAIDDELDELFEQLPAILLDGAKGVGKTATAVQRSATVRRLDDTAERAVVDAEPSIIRLDPRPTLLDEWHRVPAVWDAVRRLVDADSSGGHFLLTGSAPTGSTHSGAGRIATLRMRPLCLQERGRSTGTVSFRDLVDGARTPLAGRCELTLSDYVDEIIAGGFPAMRHLTGRALGTQLDGYIARIVDRDLPEAGYSVRRPALVTAWLRAYAAATATTASWEKIRAAATGGIDNKPSKSTTNVYTDLLVALRILDPVEAWSPSLNHFTRLASAPKHHLVDPALAVRLLQRTRQHLLTGKEGTTLLPNDGTLLGNLFESLVALSIRAYAQSAGATVSHMRAANGQREIDFVVERDGGVLAIEVKLSNTVIDRDVEHLHWLANKLGDDLIDAVVVHTGPEAYRRADGIAVVPLGLLGQ
jgi:uncharacterized protein